MKVLKYTSIALLTLGFAACSNLSNLDRSHAPLPGPAPKIELGESQSFVLDNGLKVILVENHKLPRVSYQLSVDKDPILEGEKAGYVSLAGNLLRAGTSNSSKAEIDEALDFIGADLNTSSSGIYASSLKKHQEELLKIMSDLLLHPTFPEEELKKSKKQTLSGLVSQATDPNAMSRKIQAAMVYGLDYPYGEQSTAKTVSAVTREDIEQYYNTYFRPNISYLVIVGDINLEEAKAKADKYFGSWEKGEVPTHTYNMPTPPSGNRVVFVPLVGAVQSVISVTYPVELLPGADDAIAAKVMNAILGGGVFSGRLMQNLREDKAYTYGARSSLESDKLVGSFSAGASVRNEVTDSAVVEIMHELERMTLELVADSTLELVKNSMNGSFARALENPQTIARFALNAARYNLPEEYYASYLERLAAVTKEDVLAAAKKYIHPSNCYVTIVGNKDEVGSKMARLSPTGNVEYYTEYGEPWQDLSPAPEGMTAQNVLDNYLLALGGREKLEKVHAYVRKGNMGIQGMGLDLVMSMKDNSKYKMEAFMGGSPVMTQVYDGQKGSQSQMGKTQPIEGESLTELGYEADFMLEAHYAEYGIEAELKGMKDLDGEKAYSLNLTYPSGMVSTEYYSVESGLKIRTQKSEETPMGVMNSITIIEDYIEKNGVLFPKTLKQIVGPQTIIIELSEVEVNPKLKDSVFEVK